MQQNLSKAQFAAHMYSAIQLQLQLKLYNSPEEKADLERDLQGYEELYLEAQDPLILTELGFTPIPARGFPPPPAA
jgi:hypothetical protein